jgi:hypothetical protein
MSAAISIPQDLDRQLTLDAPLLRSQATRRTMPADPRIFQILFLGVLLAAGASLRDFSLPPAQIVLTVAAALFTQHFFPTGGDARLSHTPRQAATTLKGRRLTSRIPDEVVVGFQFGKKFTQIKRQFVEIERLQEEAEHPRLDELLTIGGERCASDYNDLTVRILGTDHGEQRHCIDPKNLRHLDVEGDQIRTELAKARDGVGGVIDNAHHSAANRLQALTQDPLGDRIILDNQ